MLYNGKIAKNTTITFVPITKRAFAATHIILITVKCMHGKKNAIWEMYKRLENMFWQQKTTTTEKINLTKIKKIILL